MLFKILRKIKSLLVSNKKIESNGKHYFSHYGEDVILEYLFKNQKEGLYIDIGCYHPTLFSNTKKLHDKGWRGINIDPNIETIKLFNQERPNEINLNIAIAENVGTAEYFKFLEIDSAGGGSGNSLSLEVKEKYEKQGLTTKVDEIQTDTLANINEKYLNGRSIDFLNIDAEGFDLTVLKSNNWELFRPKLIAVEIWTKDIDFDQTTKNEIYTYLRSQKYKAISCTIYTWFFCDENNGFDL